MAQPSSRIISLEPAEVRKASRHVDEHGNTLGTIHSAAHSQAEQAWSGWVGSSQDALDELCGHWRRQTDHYTGRINHLAVNMHKTATALENTDTHTADNLSALDPSGQSAPHGSAGASVPDPRNL